MQRSTQCLANMTLADLQCLAYTCVVCIGERTDLAPVLDGAGAALHPLQQPQHVAGGRGRRRRVWLVLQAALAGSE